jgi:hypothetical protein
VLRDDSVSAGPASRCVLFAAAAAAGDPRAAPRHRWARVMIAQASLETDVRSSDTYYEVGRVLDIEYYTFAMNGDTWKGRYDDGSAMAESRYALGRNTTPTDGIDRGVYPAIGAPQFLCHFN